MFSAVPRIERVLNGVAVHVMAAEPWLLEAAARELPCHSSGAARARIRVSLSSRQPSPTPPGPLQPGARLAGYLMRGSELWLRSAGGMEFYGDLSTGVGHVLAPGAREKAEEEVGGGLGLLLSHLLRGQGFFTLHAGGVSWAGGAIVIAGVSGSGKSTTAALLAGRPGLKLLADDRMLLASAGSGTEVLPYPSRSRLRAPVDQWLQPGEPEQCGTPLPPAALLFPGIDPAEPSAVEPLPPLEALRRLLRCSVAPGPAEQVAAHLSAVAALARSTPAWRVSLGASLPRLAEQLMDALEGRDAA